MESFKDLYIQFVIKQETIDGVIYLADDCASEDIREAIKYSSPNEALADLKLGWTISGYGMSKVTMEQHINSLRTL